MMLRAAAFCGGYVALKRWKRKRCGQNRLHILLYHKVGPQAYPYFGASVRPDVFEKQMKYLSRHYHVIDFDYLSDGAIDRQHKKDLVLITFDDGYKDNYDHAYPVLKQYGLSATIFLATDYIDTHKMLWHDELAWLIHNSTLQSRKLEHAELPGEILAHIRNILGAPAPVEKMRQLASMLKQYTVVQRRSIMEALKSVCDAGTERQPNGRLMLSWAEIRRMSADGICFGGHTHSHPVLSALPDDAVRKEISVSKRMIEKHTQKEVIAFAYPYGKAEDCPETLDRLLRIEGYHHACTTTSGFEELPLQSPYRLKRKGMPTHPYLNL